MASVKKNNQSGKWDFVFDLGKHPFSGRRRQIRRRGFKTKREAQQELSKLRAELLENEITNTTSIPYNKYMDEWLSERVHQLQKNTINVHKIYYESVIKPRLGHFKLQELSPIHIQHFINQIVYELNYSEHTIHLIYRIVSGSLKRATVLKLIKTNPAEGVIIPKIKYKEMNIWTLEEANSFLEHARNTKRLTRCYIGFLIAILTGMRQGEILGLRWKDVDLDNNLIYIRQTLTQSGEIKAGAKNKSSLRTIHIPNSLVKNLKEHRNLIRREKLRIGKNYNDLDLVNCTQKGNPIIPRNFRKEFYNLVYKLELPTIRFHDLRHTHATILIQQNVNVKLISERLGHADITTTLNTYSHIIPSMQKEISDRLDNIINL
ncbi:tyrosine-type recombinase/integrase [Priestia aryabhattai]